MTVPILMYHHIAPPQGGDTSYLWVSPSAFAAQMQQLHDEGYEAVTLAQVFDSWEENEPLPRKPVVITFDDGLLDVYTEAAPILDKYGWKGVINVNTWAITGGAAYAMTRGQMMRLVKRGWEVGCHSTSHRNMTALSAAELEEEIVLARDRIEFLLKAEIEFFCYPGGAYDEQRDRGGQGGRLPRCDLRRPRPRRLDERFRYAASRPPSPGSTSPPPDPRPAA